MKTSSVAVKTMKNSLLLPWPRDHQSNANKYFNLTSIFQIKNIFFKTKFQDQIGSTNAKFPKRVSQTLRPWEETFGASIKLLYKNTWYRFISFFFWSCTIMIIKSYLSLVDITCCVISVAFHLSYYQLLQWCVSCELYWNGTSWSWQKVIFNACIWSFHPE